MNNTIKCSHCNKIFFKTDSDICPFCKKNINDTVDKFKEMFGKDNPFNDLFGGKS